MVGLTGVTSGELLKPLKLGEMGSSSKTFYRCNADIDNLPIERMPQPLRILLDHWLLLREENNGELPRRTQLDPVRLKDILAHLIVWDVVPDARGFCCRLAGTMVCEAAGRELRGVSVADMHFDSPIEVRADFDHVRDAVEFSYVERKMDWVNLPYRLYRRLLAPLGGRNGEVTHLVGVICFERLS